MSRNLRTRLDRLEAMIKFFRGEPGVVVLAVQPPDDREWDQDEERWKPNEKGVMFEKFLLIGSRYIEDHIAAAADLEQLRALGKQHKFKIDVIPVQVGYEECWADYFDRADESSENRQVN